MSTFAPATLMCPCGERVHADVADGLHISRLPEVRRAILDGTFHRFPCPACGRVLQIEKLLAYTDFPRRHWFTVVPERDLAIRGRWIQLADESFRTTMVDRAAPIVKSWAPEFTRRVVFGLASLREKLVLSDEGLDDRLIELLKLDLRRELGLLEEPGAYLFVSRRSSSRSIVVEFSRPGGAGTSEAEVSLDGYEELAAADPDELAARVPGMWDGLVVDHRVLLVRDEDAGDPDLPAAIAPPVMGEDLPGGDA